MAIRRFLAITGLCLAVLPIHAFSQAAGEAARLEALIARNYRDDLANDPTLRTEMTLTRSEATWTPVTDAWRARVVQESIRRLAELRTIQRPRLPAAEQLRYDIAVSTLRGNLVEGRVTLSSYDDSTNIYDKLWRLPQLMIRNQKIMDEVDARNYIARLRGLAPVLGDMLAAGDARHIRGIVLIKNLYGQLATQARDLSEGTPCSAGPRSNTLAADFRTKLAASQIPVQIRDELISAADAALREATCPAYAVAADRIAKLATEGRLDGLWALPNGAAAYRDEIEFNLGERLAPEALYRLGLREVKRLRGEIASIAAQLGISPDPTSIAALVAENPDVSVPNTDEGYEQYQARAQDAIALIAAKLPAYFNHIPTTPLLVERALQSLSGGPPSPGSYYEPGLRDGSKPGVYFLAFPPGPARYSLISLRSLTFHEGMPGHHLQFSTADEIARGMEDLRGRQYTNYIEGWALYAEQLAYEMGAYEQDPYSILGWRQMQLERAVRLVLDPGINYKKWSIAQAEAYQVSALGGRPNVARFLEMPGQALGYTWGFRQILALRERAQRALKDRFDIKAFHSALLDKGPLPPKVMRSRVDAMIERLRAGR